VWVTAQEVPIQPSGCAFGTIEVRPDGAFPFASFPPTGNDVFRITWDPAADMAHFELQDLLPRRLLGADGEGTVTLPALVEARVRESGDLEVLPLSVLLFRQGIGSTPLQTALTTGLVGEGAALDEGAPLASDGSFALVGRDEGAKITLRLTGRALPPPDVTEFAPAPHTLRVSGRLGTRCRRGVCSPIGRLQATFVSPDTAPLDCTAPVRLRVSFGGETVATASVTGGLTRRGGGCAGAGPDGERVSVHRLGGRRGRRWTLVVGPLVYHPAFNTLPPGGRVSVTWAVGGLVVHGAPAFSRRASARGVRVRLLR